MFTSRFASRPFFFQMLDLLFKITTCCLIRSAQFLCFLIHKNDIGIKNKPIFKLNAQLKKINHIGWYIGIIYWGYISSDITNINKYIHKIIWPIFLTYRSSWPWKTILSRERPYQGYLEYGWNFNVPSYRVNEVMYSNSPYNKRMSNVVQVVLEPNCLKFRSRISMHHLHYHWIHRIRKSYTCKFSNIDRKLSKTHYSLTSCKIRKICFKTAVFS